MFTDEHNVRMGLAPSMHMTASTLVRVLRSLGWETGEAWQWVRAIESQPAHLHRCGRITIRAHEHGSASTTFTMGA